jgi:hypothetical protein
MMATAEYTGIRNLRGVDIDRLLSDAERAGCAALAGAIRQEKARREIGKARADARQKQLAADPNALTEKHRSVLRYFAAYWQGMPYPHPGQPDDEWTFLYIDYSDRFGGVCMGESALIRHRRELEKAGYLEWAGADDDKRGNPTVSTWRISKKGMTALRQGTD